MTGLIVIDRLSKRFGNLVAVDEISLDVPKGEVLGFLGPNGAGKSTTMKMACGFLAPDHGSTQICGIDIAKNPRAAKRHLGYLPEGAPAYGEMTARAFLSFVAEVRGVGGSARRTAIDSAIERTGLQSVVDQSVETLSKGFKRRVGLAQAILHDPDVLILDEPTDGLDPNQKHEVRKLIKKMAPEKAIVVSTHILEEVDAVCTRAVIIDKGRIVADGTSRELKLKLPYHNAVSLRIATDDFEKTKAALEALKGVVKVEARRGKKTSHLRAMPNGGRSIATAVAQCLTNAAVHPDELFVEHGSLDDVFHQITTSETGKTTTGETTNG